MMYYLLMKIIIFNCVPLIRTTMLRSKPKCNAILHNSVYAMADAHQLDQPEPI